MTIEPAGKISDCEWVSKLPHDAKLLVDFDHTLFGANSTEQFILHARPRWLASLALALTRELFPWVYFSVSKWTRVRDYAALVIVVAFAPWNLPLWRRRAPSVFEKHTRHDLAEAIGARPNGSMVIVSFGFRFIIAPLLRGSKWQDAPLICMPSFASLAKLRRGKLELVRDSGIAVALSRSAFVTDSQDDADLLAAIGQGRLIEPIGEMVNSSEKLYFPLRYAAAAKFSVDEVRDQVLFVDFVVILLSTNWNGAEFGLGIVPLIAAKAALFGSLMSIYEVGYFENDMVAAAREKNPTLKPASRRFRDFPLERMAWRWALMLGLVGCAAAGGLDAVATGRHVLVWTVVLVVLRAVYFVYNRIAEQRRTALYPVLQFLKYVPVALIWGAGGVGYALLAAQSLAMWATYCVYRAGGRPLEFRREEFRLGAFLVLTAGLLVVDPVQTLSLTLAATIVLWCIWRINRGAWRKLARRGTERAVRWLRSFGPSPAR